MIFRTFVWNPQAYFHYLLCEIAHEGFMSIILFFSFSELKIVIIHVTVGNGS